jgi:hypothetical protein
MKISPQRREKKNPIYVNDFLTYGNVSYFAPLPPALSPRWVEREYCRDSFFFPSPPRGERVRVRRNKFTGSLPFAKTLGNL